MFLKLLLKINPKTEKYKKIIYYPYYHRNNVVIFVLENLKYICCMLLYCITNTHDGEMSKGLFFSYQLTHCFTNNYRCTNTNYDVQINN